MDVSHTFYSKVAEHGSDTSYTYNSLPQLRPVVHVDFLNLGLIYFHSVNTCGVAAIGLLATRKLKFKTYCNGCVMTGVNAFCWLSHRPSPDGDPH